MELQFLVLNPWSDCLSMKAPIFDFAKHNSSNMTEHSKSF